MKLLIISKTLCLGMFFEKLLKILKIRELPFVPALNEILMNVVLLHTIFDFAACFLWLFALWTFSPSKTKPRLFPTIAKILDVALK